MKLRNVLLSVFALGFSTLSVATPVVLDFEANHYEGTYNGGKVYSGFVINGLTISSSAPLAGAQSAISSAGVNQNPPGISITRKDGALFDLNSFLFKGKAYPASEGSYIKINGYLKGQEKYSRILGSSDVSNTNADFLGIDTISFEIWHSYGYSLAIDNLSFDVKPLSPINPVPEPSTYAMMLAGLGMVGLIARRRRASSQA